MGLGVLVGTETGSLWSVKMSNFSTPGFWGHEYITYDEDSILQNRKYYFLPFSPINPVL